MPTEEICTHFNELRSDLVLLYELKMGLSSCEYELQALRHQYEALAPGKSLEIPASLLSSASGEGSSTSISNALPEELLQSRPKTLSEVIDVVGSAATPMVIIKINFQITFMSYSLFIFMEIAQEESSFGAEQHVEKN